MDITLSPVNIINIIFIAIGIGICGLCILQITASIHIQKVVRRYFQYFFSCIILYIASHMVREIMNGLPGEGFRAGLYIVTFVEMVAAGIMTQLLSLLIIVVAKKGEKINAPALVVYSITLVHVVMLIAFWPFDLAYGFNANNEYFRGPLYLLTNLAPVLMLGLDVFLLIKYRKNIAKPVAIAFWLFVLAPVVAIAIQSFLSGVQLIIIVTVFCAIYMFSVVMYRQTMVYQQQKVDSSRIEAELTMASSIQSDMLPSIYPAFPDRSEFDIYASMTPAKEVGGDFYNFFLVDDDHLCFMIADVSGKGVPAALFMMATMIVLANNAMLGKSPAQILGDANKAICSSNKEGMFVTVWLGILELSTGKLTASNAGHELPIIAEPNGNYEYIKDKHGLVIGGYETAKYTDYTIELKPGSKLFVYTDGVTEATSADDQLFGFDRLKEALNKDASLHAKEACENISSSINDFVNGAEQFDDITMLCLEYKGSKK